MRAIALALLLTLSAPEADRRTPDQTFLTFPEWFLVFSPAEYATFVKTHPPSEFPFWGHLGQFWSSYRAVYEQAKAFPFNGEYHLMIVVIGVSTTVEYGIRSAYETLVGRVTEATTTYPETEEDRIGAEVAQAYVDFIRIRPWYEFDFVTPLKRVWTASPWGAAPLRKWERRYALTSEYAVKAAYGWILGRGSQASFGVAGSTTLVVVDHRPATLPEGVEVKAASAVGEPALLSVPRYQAFTDRATALARDGVVFQEIAGNQGDILLSALVPAGWQLPAGQGRLLFEQTVITNPAEKRVAVVVPVARLHAALATLSTPPQRLEHVFDY